MSQLWGWRKTKEMCNLELEVYYGRHGLMKAQRNNEARIAARLRVLKKTLIGTGKAGVKE